MNPHPYSPAYLAGGFGFVSGALSVNEDGQAVNGRLEAVEAATARLSERLQTVGLSLADVIKTTYFVTDVSLREEANRHYERTYASPRPARSFVEVAALPYGATVEIEAIAHQDPTRSTPAGA